MVHHRDAEARSDRPLRFWVKPWWFVLGAAVVLCGLLLSLTFIDPAAYRWWQIKTLERRFAASGNSTVLNRCEERLLGRPVDRLHDHLQALVDLSELNLLRFSLGHVKCGSDRERELGTALMEASRTNKLVNATWGGANLGDPVKLRLWCRPEYTGHWKQFVAEFNLPSQSGIAESRESE